MAAKLFLAIALLLFAAGCAAPRQSLEDFETGNRYYYSGAYGRAIDSFTKAIEATPDLCEAYNNRGLAYQAAGEPEKAIADYSTAIECSGKAKRNPGDADPAAEAYNNRGTVYHEQADYQQAIADFSKAIEGQPNFTKAYYDRGLVYIALGNTDAAVQDFEHTLETTTPGFKAHPPAATPQSTAAAEFGAGIERSLAEFQKQQEDSGIRAGRPEILVGLASAYYAQGRYDRVIEHLSEEVRYEAGPEILARAFKLRGQAYYAQSEYDLAIGDYGEAIRLLSAALVPQPTRIIDILTPQPRDSELRLADAPYEAILVDAYRNRALAYNARGDIELAIGDLEKVWQLEGRTGTESSEARAEELQALTAGSVTPAAEAPDAGAPASSTPPPPNSAAPPTPAALPLLVNTDLAACVEKPLYQWRAAGTFEYDAEASA